MIEQLRSAIDSLSDPSIRHAAMVHMPIVLASICTLLALAAALLHKNVTVRVIAVVAAALFVVSCFVTVNSGENAEDAIKGVLPNEVDDILHEHEEMAEKLWMFAAAATGLLLLSAIPKPIVRHGSAALAVITCASAIGWVTITAHLGGTLVYTHGIGTPRPGARPADASNSNSNSAAPVVPATNPSGGGSGSGGDAGSGAGGGDIRLVFFREQVQPILSENCFQCHNPRRVAAGKSGKLDQTSLAGLLQGGRSGPAIVPGKPDDSLLIHRIRGDDPDEERMPPDDHLPPESIQILMQWIADGAVWDEPANPQAP